MSTTVGSPVGEDTLDRFDAMSKQEEIKFFKIEFASFDKRWTARCVVAAPSGATISLSFNADTWQTALAGLEEEVHRQLGKS